MKRGKSSNFLAVGPTTPHVGPYWQACAMHALSLKPPTNFKHLEWCCKRSGRGPHLEKSEEEHAGNVKHKPPP